MARAVGSGAVGAAGVVLGAVLAAGAGGFDGAPGVVAGGAVAKDLAAIARVETNTTAEVKSARDVCIMGPRWSDGIHPGVKDGMTAPR